MIVVLLILLFVFALYVLSTMCRNGHKGLQKLYGWSYAHRGLHENGIPENSLLAFRKAVEAGYGIELDVHLLADGNLAVIHDSSLLRTAGIDRNIEDAVTSDLEQYYLESSLQTVPTLDQVLDLVAGKVPLIVEVKSRSDNYDELTEKIANRMDSYHGVYCMESFDPRCVRWLRKHRPDIIRGQLTENYFASKTSKLSWPLKLLLTHQMMNFLTFPDFVAYQCSDRRTISNLICRRLWGAAGVTWTLRDPQDYKKAVEEGWLPIFEGFRP